MNIIGLVRAFHGKRPLTRKQAQAICDAIDESYITNGQFVVHDAGIVQELNREFPTFKWRVILCHDRERTYCVVTIKDPDPRELSEMRRRGAWIDDEYVPYKKGGKR